MNAASEGLARLSDLRIPYRIPADYYAERVKPDAHMARIKDRLIEEKQKMESVAERRAQKENRKFAKKVQATKLQEKQKEKKANLEAAGRMRKKGGGEEGIELGVERSLLPGVQQHLQANRREEDERRQRRNFKREAKDKKYGFGGKKRNIKRNDRTSARDDSEYKLSNNRSFNKGSFKGFKEQKPGSYGDRRSQSNKGQQRNRNGSAFNMGRVGSHKKGGKPNRPGKAARAQSRK